MRKVFLNSNAENYCTLIYYIYMIAKTILGSTILFLFIVEIHNQCCLQFVHGLCEKCPPGMHLYRHNCIFDLPNCIEY